jgi:hypothetical protein
VEIEQQQDMGIGEDWEREDQYLADVNLEDLESTSGTNQDDSHSKGGTATETNSTSK